MRYFSAEEILFIHYRLITVFGGSHGVRDLSRLESVRIAPAQEAFGVVQYPEIYDKAAVYLRNIILDHPFIDGNKRTGMTVAIEFLKLNNYQFAARKGEIENFAVQVATDNVSINEIAAWLKRHCRT